MKIGIIGHLKYPISEPFAGGLEMHTHLLATMLISAGHDVTLFAAQGSDPATGFIPLCPPTGPNSVASAYAEHQAYAALMSHLSRADFEIIHNNSLHYLPLECAASLPVPMVTTLHTPPFESLAHAATRMPLHEHRFIPISRTTANEWAPILDVDPVIPNGIDLARFRFRSHTAAIPYWVWHGRIVPEKGLHIAIDAARCAGVRLRFAGPIVDTDYFAAEIAPRLAPGISYAGHLTHQALASLIGGAEICLATPRWEEPFGLVVAESLACGTPIAGLRRGALPELIDASCGVLIDGEDPIALAAAAIAARELDRNSCRARAATHWNATRMVSQYVDLYETLVDRRNLRRAA
jgi:glycosyltransferase involved in cell wall biosynthesis